MTPVPERIVWQAGDEVEITLPKEAG